MDLKQFMQTVVTSSEGWLPLCIRSDKGWVHDWFRYPSQLDDFVITAKHQAEKYDVYSTSALWEKPERKRMYLVEQGYRTIQCDFDNADMSTVQFIPSVSVRSSRGRFQGELILSESVDADYLERLSRKYTCNIVDADRSGWPLGRCIRLPETYNYKYGERQLVEVTGVSGKIYKPSDLDELPEVELKVANDDLAWIDEGFQTVTFTVGPNELLESIKFKLAARLVTQYNIVVADRSEYLWALECGCFRAGLSREEVFYLAKHSANNKWTSVVHGDRELAKDVLRAERTIPAPGTRDVKQIVAATRKIPGTRPERSSYLLSVVSAALKAEGHLVRATDDSTYFVQRGLVIPIARRSRQFEVYLTNNYGLNASEEDYHYVVNGIWAEATKLPATAIKTALSYFDESSGSVFIHGGDKQVAHVTSQGTTFIENGDYGIIFQRGIVEPFSFKLNAGSTPTIDWGEELFGPFTRYVLDLTHAEIVALYKVWLLFVVMRSASVTRPILALLGAPGSGKSTLFQLVNILLYGPSHGIDGVDRNEENFDTATSNYPFVALDNLDSWVPWMMNRLAQLAGNTSVTRRAKYTDNDVATIRRTAVIGVTAHDPKFTRPDVIDRMLIINHTRIPDNSRVDERAMHDKIKRLRGELWGAIIQDIERILRTRRPLEARVSLRVQDFAVLGEWFSTAIGCNDAFVSAIRKIKGSQKQLTIEEDELLISVMFNYIKRSQHSEEWRVIGAVWFELEFFAEGRAVDFVKKYKDAKTLGRRLMTLFDTLNQVMTVEWMIDEEKGWKLWRIRSKATS